jgi:hypothetical protein
MRLNHEDTKNTKGHEEIQRLRIARPVGYVPSLSTARQVVQLYSFVPSCLSGSCI